MPIMSPLPDFKHSSLAMLADWADCDQLPPVEQWHPARSGTIDIRIMADGRWFHEGGEIRRPAMVRLFSRILRREEDGSFVLVTPAERLTITVDDAPFVAVELKQEGQGEAGRLAVRLNTDEIVVIGADHPLTLRTGPAGLLPYVHVRGPMERPLLARPTRALYHELALMADARAQVFSGGMGFAVGETA
jgi:hypothetical protein